MPYIGIAHSILLDSRRAFILSLPNDVDVRCKQQEPYWKGQANSTCLLARQLIIFTDGFGMVKSLIS